MKLTRYINESSDIVKKAKQILADRKENEKEFERSLKKFPIKGIKSRVKFKSKEYGEDAMMKQMMLIAIDKYEDILNIPKNRKYSLKMVDQTSSTSHGGEGQHYSNKTHTDLEMVRSVFGIGKDVKKYFTILHTLAHEMIHVEQFVSGKSAKWDKADWKKPWAKRAWEIDASKREDAVFKELLKRLDDLYLGSDVKIDNGKIWVLKKGKPTGFDLATHYKELAKEVPNLSFGDVDLLEYEMEWEEM